MKPEDEEKTRKELLTVLATLALAAVWALADQWFRNSSRANAPPCDHPEAAAQVAEAVPVDDTMISEQPEVLVTSVRNANANVGIRFCSAKVSYADKYTMINYMVQWRDPVAEEDVVVTLTN